MKTLVPRPAIPAMTGASAGNRVYAWSGHCLDLDPICSLID
jgi:hypothetical protein